MGDVEAAAEQVNLARRLAERADTQPLVKNQATASGTAADPRPPPTPSLVGRCALQLGVLDELRGRYESAVRLLQEALALFRAEGSLREEARALNSLAVVVQRQGDYSANRDYLEASLVIKRRLGDSLGENVSLNNLAIATYECHSLAEAADYFERCRRLSRKIGDREGEVSALAGLGEIAISRGDLVAAGPLLAAGLEQARRIGDRQSQAGLVGGQARLALVEGRPAAGRALAYEALQLAQELEDPFTEARLLQIMGSLLLAMEDESGALLAFAKAERIYQSLGMKSSATEALAGQSAAFLAAGQLAEALAAAEGVLATLPLTSGPPPAEALAGVAEPGTLFLALTRVLRAAEDERAVFVLEAAIGWLERQAGMLPAEERPAFWALPAHRELRQS
jgi:tetratricopeptide (TPR) repeat protein